MKRSIREIGRTSVCAGLFAACVLIAPPAGAGFADELDRMWQDVNPVPRDQCRMFIVKAWPDKIYRGRTVAVCDDTWQPAEAIW